MSIIKVENLSKRYIIGHDRQAAGMFRYKSLRDSLTHWGRSAYQRFRHPLSPNRENTDLEEFWALKDINFEINQGDRVGIIGRNGAGKSTLLKILSRITEPTTGKIQIKGRVASLLEVGTGFHPELKGRENIYLNGAVLGMTRVEIKRKFDEIVAFAEVEKFLDTPVKHYSSGMYVRLAFAVAAHLEPEILVVDEVLAVGDLEFQKKCLGKMEDVAKEGRTVIFVSHNMAAVRSLCGSGILLRDGAIEYKGDISQVIDEYLSGSTATNAAAIDLTGITNRKGNGKLRFKSISFHNKGRLSNKYSIGDDLVFSFAVKAREPVRNVKFAFQLFTSDGFAIGNIIDCDSGFKVEKVDGEIELAVTLKDIRFYPDQYRVGLWAGGIESIEQYDCLEPCASFEVVDGGKLTSRTLPRTAGLLFLTPEWEKTGVE